MRTDRPTFKSCSDLPLEIFIQILVHDDKSLLYSRPNKPWYKPVYLQELWDSIFMEYIELSNDDRSKAILELQKEIATLSHKLFIIQQSVTLLSQIQDVSGYQLTIGILKTYGFNYKFTNETLINDLRKTVKSAKQLIIKRDQFKSELEDINKNEQEKATEKDFYVHLANISEAMGFAVDPKNTTVMQYIGYLDRFNVKIKHERTANT